jgi:hypothetical protein
MTSLAEKLEEWKREAEEFVEWCKENDAIPSETYLESTRILALIRGLEKARETWLGDTGELDSVSFDSAVLSAMEKREG